jgi:tRNA A37 threonylcarbamoyladenosine dehydratase
MWYDRTEILIGKENIEKLKNLHVAVFGVGGVGSYAVEALVRAGVGKITIVDADNVDETNINRQLLATVDVVGEAKVDVLEKRILSINPKIKVHKICDFYSAENREKFFENSYDYVVDAIDSIASKIDLIKYCYDNNIKIISSMGTANKLEPLKLKVTDINKTIVCPLAKIIRKKAKEFGIKKLKVVYSEELPIKNENTNILGSISFVPSVAGLIIASEVVRDIIKI